MKKFREYISEEVVPSALVANGTIDIDNEDVRASINLALAKVTADGAITPYIALNRISKALSYFHIILPKRIYLEGAKGVEVHEIRQFGHKMGMTDQGEFVHEVPGKYYLFMQYGMNPSMGLGHIAYPHMGGTFRVMAKVVDQMELDRLVSMAELAIAESCDAEMQQKRAKMLAPHDTMHDVTSDEKKVGNKKAVAVSQKGLDEDKDPCWKGYEMVGMKNKRGRKVPNCVPVKEGLLDKLNPFGAVAKALDTSSAKAAPKPDMRIMGNPDTAKKQPPKDGSANSAFPTNEETINEISHKLALRAMKKSEKRSDDEYEADSAYDRLSDYKTHEDRAKRLRGHMRKKFGNDKPGRGDKEGDNLSDRRMSDRLKQGKRAGMPSREHITNLKTDIKVNRALGKHKKVNLPEETLDEISQQLAGRYRSLADTDLAHRTNKALRDYQDDKPTDKKNRKKSLNRVKGIRRAGKYFKEETQIDEISKSLVKRYKKAAESDKKSAESSAETSRMHRKNRALPLTKRNAFHDEEKWLKGIAKKREKGIAMADKRLEEKAPPGAKYERMVKHIKAGYAKDGLTKKEKGIAYATAWKAKNRESKD